MKKSVKLVLDILSRYSILIFIGLTSSIIYFVLAPFTILPLFFLFKIFFSNVSMLQNVLTVNSTAIEVINPCIAGSAYYLLLILNLSTRGIAFEKRVKLILFSFFSFLIANLLRIVLLSALFIFGISFFDLAHKIFWYAGSTIIVVGIWFFSVKLFRINEIPFYSDFKFLLNLGKKTKKTKSSKKH